ncbi:hypothetical protein BDN71DRAFT_1454250 [Pleurotus eryngii]|uniref:histone acetyltransferase n=1 Tax=Pleurotus eryngii TaxID=5323 RepID=A0A9P6D460_PLEER|nr:hypothetical protein BDN71DRAFT_1454250 [Pleurotus eryngii]
MPKTHVVPVTADIPTHFASKSGIEEPVHVLARRSDEVYVHYVNLDKRMDEWLPGDTIHRVQEAPPSPPPRKRKRSSSSRLERRRASTSRSSLLDIAHTAGTSGTMNGRDAHSGGRGAAVEEMVITEEDFDIRHHNKITAQRNFDKVNFGMWQIKTWYFSPYPLTEVETDDIPVLNDGTMSPSPSASKIHGITRTSARSHGRTSDLLAGGLQRSHMSSEKATLWVCDKCFKYMADGSSWELHVRTCDWRHPPGRKVYQKGAHTIWEVDGAKDKLFCQNLSLFGKLFIDIKTLFFDCDNFLFYILTDAASQRDHVLGFFSKEKLSYDDYNLACIITFPPYQRRGYGMLLIEFSYELSRRAGKVGTPERPLSDLGLRSYLTYWVSTVIRFLRRLLSVLPPEKDSVEVTGSLPDLSSVASPPDEDGGSMIKRKKKTKGWDGEAVDDAVTVPSVYAEDPLTTTMRTVVFKSNPDGSASVHVYVKCTLEDIARATNLRVEDAAFALNECGLLEKVRIERRKAVETGEDPDGEEDVETIVLTREMVETVARERSVKRMMMNMRNVLL